MSDTTTRKKVLIVDDEPDVVTFLGAWLEDHGYESYTASSVEEGLGFVVRQQPDLVLMDVKMPRQTGLELYRAMKAEEPMAAIPVIIITGLNTYDLFGEGCDRLPEPAARIQKPIDQDLLLSSIRRALER